ncbi:MAG: glycosyltransferase [bacterium]|nr:glycosyltransferase [bacterium]
MKKIIILSLHLGYGGIEKAITSLANTLIDKYKVEIISTYKLYDKPAFAIDKRVKISYLMHEKPNKEIIKEKINNLSGIKSFIDLIKEGLYSIKVLYKRKKLMINKVKKEDADIFISTRDFHNKILSKYVDDNKVKIGWEHNYKIDDNKYIKRLMRSIKGLNYLVLPTKELRDFYKDKTKVTCIYIPLILDYIPLIKSNLATNNILAIGRLSKVKGYSSLIDVFKLVNDKVKESHLTIIGDGEERTIISDKIKEHKLQNNVTLTGFLTPKQIEKHMLNASVFVITSYSESFGLVVLEAMSYGIPCVVFSSARGCLEMVKDNVNGFVIEDRDKIKMAEALVKIITNKELNKRLASATAKVIEKYKPDNVKKHWLNLLSR